MLHCILFICPPQNPSLVIFCPPLTQADLIHEPAGLYEGQIQGIQQYNQHIYIYIYEWNLKFHNTVAHSFHKMCMHHDLLKWNHIQQLHEIFIALYFALLWSSDLPMSFGAASETLWWRHQMKYFPCYWPFVLGIHRSPVNFPHKGQWCRALKFSWISA